MVLADCHITNYDDHKLQAEVIYPNMLYYCFMTLIYNNTIRHVWS